MLLRSVPPGSLVQGYSSLAGFSDVKAGIQFISNDITVHLQADLEVNGSCWASVCTQVLVNHSHPCIWTGAKLAKHHSHVSHGHSSLSLG